MAQRVPCLLAPPTSMPMDTNIVYTNDTNPLRYDLIRHIHVCNPSSDEIIYITFYVGQSGQFSMPGTELCNWLAVKPGSFWDWYGMLVLNFNDWIRAGASHYVATYTIEGECGVIE
jgi:hypothetical protein